MHHSCTGKNHKKGCKPDKKTDLPEQTATGKAKGKGYTIGGADAHDVVTDVTIQSVGMPSAEICFTDTLKAGDEVLLVVSPDNQTYFVIGKVIKIGDE